MYARSSGIDRAVDRDGPPAGRGVPVRAEVHGAHVRLVTSAYAAIAASRSPVAHTTRAAQSADHGGHPGRGRGCAGRHVGGAEPQHGLHRRHGERRLSVQITTRSPWRTPAPDSAWARASARWSSSR